MNIRRIEINREARGRYTVKVVYRNGDIANSTHEMDTIDDVQRKMNEEHSLPAGRWVQGGGGWNSTWKPHHLPEGGE